MGLVALCFATSIMTASVGCDSRSEPAPYPVHLAGVYDQSEQWGLDPRVAEEAARRALGRVDQFEITDLSGDGVLEARVIYGQLPEGAKPDQLLVYIAIDSPQELQRALRGRSFDATVLMERKSHDSESLVVDLEGAVERGGRVLEARVDLARGRPDRVERLLRSQDAELTLLALEWLRDHPDGAHAEHVVHLLDHHDERIALTAIEALGAIGGPEHAPALLRRLQLADAGRTHRAYDALGSLGGPEAVAFLEFAARNEDEPERQAAARQALERARTAPNPTAELPSLEGHRR
jgi:hypothetical protein